MSQFERRQWQITERPFRPCDLPHTETIYTIGNGLYGVRGTFEEGYPGDTSTTLAAGIFNHVEGELVPELVAMPNPLELIVHINGEPFRLDQGTIMGYERVLDMQCGTLSRGVLWLSPQGTRLRLHFERFASLHDEHLLALRVLVQPLSEGTHTISIENRLDGNATNPGGISHWGAVQVGADAETLHFIGETNQSGYQVALAADLHVDGAAVQCGADDQSGNRAGNRATHTATFELAGNQIAYVTKLVTLHTSRDGDDPLRSALDRLKIARASGYSVLKAAHDSAWAAAWDKMDILIEGDEVAQKAVRFCMYHLLIAAPHTDERVSVAAKTLSGYGYKGHVFWDTELFIVPPFTLADPESARRLLMYRHHNLQGARDKATEAGYQGAMFPWESTDTGQETTPRWTEPHPISGERIRIWTGDNEQHISSDIAYAALQFWRWTGDDDWFAAYGAELVLDTAVFWGSRVEYNAEAGRYELSMQIGPDEYHENVNNSVFTNRLVKWHLEQAAEVHAWLQAERPADGQRLSAALGIEATMIDHWREVAARMFIPMSDENGGVFEQFEGFFDQLQAFNLADYTPRTKNIDWMLGQEKMQSTRVIKQADVVMLMALLGDELGDHDFLLRNWQTYLPVVDHGSSLSPSIHAWVAARLGLVDEAYDLFIYSATIDLEDHKGNVHDGIHAASCGGVWQAVVFGFCGLRLTADGVTVAPCLPEHWRRVRFTVQHKGQPVTIDITPEGVA